MKKWMIFIFGLIFLLSFVLAYSNSSQANNSNSQNNSRENQAQQRIQAQLGTANQSTETRNESKLQIQNKVQGQQQIRNRIQEKNKLRVNNKTEECPENCSCMGSVTKCYFEGKREMTILAGKSGNTILQIKEMNISTNVELYKDGEDIYGQFREGQVKKVNLMPQQIKQKLQEKISSKFLEENMQIELDENGNYQVQIKKQAKLLGIIKVKEKIRAEFDAETGETIKTKNSWWGFLAKNVESEPLLGANCGTVTPGTNDECCQNKDYDAWNAEKQECVFSE